MWADASVAFTGVPSGPATDPSSANQLARKAYVDAADVTTLASAATAATNALVGYNPGGITAVKVQGGNAFPTVDGSGNFTVTFPVAFPTATICVVICPGLTSEGADWCVQTNYTAWTRTAFTGRVIIPSTNSGKTSGGWGLAWIAIGN